MSEEGPAPPQELPAPEGRGIKADPDGIGAEALMSEENPDQPTNEGASAAAPAAQGQRDLSREEVVITQPYILTPTWIRAYVLTPPKSRDSEIVIEKEIVTLQ